MIVVILATVFLCAFSAQGENINCYTCVQGNIPQNGLKFRYVSNVPNIPVCTDPIENSKTTAVNTDGSSCVKLDVKGTFKYQGTEYTADGSVRYYFPSGKCGPLENLITDIADLVDQDLSVSCYECNDDKCNSASSVQISLLVFFALVLSYFMLS